ncbi:hypothetical protein SDC9_183121 [bioreactor metagenome]|uniref:Uncharacterized protein n=1 Tax=bioreactor metagenome TaxID=1076179 RepID=A0A645HIZ5_9ZZZZ
MLVIHRKKRFPIEPPAESRSATSRIIDADQFETLVLRSGPERRFSETGMADDGRFLSIDFRDGFQTVEHTGESPRPCTDGGIIVRTILQFFLFEEQRVNAGFPSILIVRKEIMV